MSIQERADRVTTAPPSRLRTELNVAAAVVAVSLSLIILALLAGSPARRPPHPARRPAHAQSASVIRPGRSTLRP